MTETGAPFAELPLLYGDGERNDTPALQALVEGKPVRCGWCLALFAPRQRALASDWEHQEDCPRRSAWSHWIGTWPLGTFRVERSS